MVYLIHGLIPSRDKCLPMHASRRRTFYGLLTILVCVSEISCSPRGSVPEDLNAGYNIVVYPLGEDCEGYFMVFDAGPTKLRYAVSGPCKEIDFNTYLNGFLMGLRQLDTHTLKNGENILIDNSDFV